jgi:hypothetical protein
MSRFRLIRTRRAAVDHAGLDRGAIFESVTAEDCVKECVFPGDCHIDLAKQLVRFMLDLAISRCLFE